MDTFHVANLDMLLTRDQFREGVFKRDKHRCVVCHNPAVDAHHIIERKIWDDGGYYLDNGVSLCERCHMKAEQTIISCDELRNCAGITTNHLPAVLFDRLMDDDRITNIGKVSFDKWGNLILADGNRRPGPMFNTEQVQKILKQAKLLHLFVEEKYVKYPRTYHLPYSEKASADDKRLSSTEQFAGKEVVATIKLDGENTSLYQDHIHARSLDSVHHPSRDWVKGLWGSLKHEIPDGWRICGENVYALHTIPYNNLETYFYVFSIWDNTNTCLSWDETVAYCEMLGLKTVPVIYRGIFDQEKIQSAFPSTHNGDPTEGYVVRLTERFHYDEFENSLAKYVSKSFVIEGAEHWMQNAMIPNKLNHND